MDVESRMLLLLILLLNITVSVSAIQDVKVSCRNEKICALKESSVNLMCSYSNINITTGFWFSLKDKAKWRKEEQPEDLALDSDYAGRVSYTEMTNFSSTLTITDLRERDSGEYRLMFITDKGEKFLSSAGVTLTVTGDEQSSTVVSNLHAVWGVGALLIVVPCIKRKRGAETDTDIQSVPTPGENTYTTLNPMTMSPDYDTLQNVQGSASDSYTTLNHATMSSDYDTLRGVATRLSEEKYPKVLQLKNEN